MSGCDAIAMYEVPKTVRTCAGVFELRVKS